MLIQVLALIVFFRSKRNSLWIFAVCFIVFAPGGFFGSDQRDLYLVSSATLGVVSFEMAFVIVAALKVLKNGYRPPSYSNKFWLFMIYVGFLVAIWGGKPVSLIRQFIFFSWLLLLPNLLENIDDYNKFFKAVVYTNIFMVLFNVFQIITGSSVAAFVSRSGQLIRDVDSDALIRTVNGINIAHLGVVIGLIILISREHRVSKPLAYGGLVLGVLNIVASATRGWMIGVAFIVLVFSFINVPRLFQNIVVILPTIFLTVLILLQVPLIRNQMSMAVDRLIYYENFYSVEALENVDEIGRLRRGERVFTKFKESPIIGFGLGTEARQYMDAHSGNQSVLLNFGLIGFILLLVLWVAPYIRISQLMYRRLISRNEYQRGLLMFISIVSAFIIHSTSGAFLHPTIGGVSIFWYSVFFAYSEFIGTHRLGMKK